MNKRKADCEIKIIDPRLQQDTQFQKRLQEKDVFITEYVNKSNAFSAIIKHRYSDFQVNEINQESKVVHLTSLNTVSQNSETIENDVDIFDNEVINIEDEPTKELDFPLVSDNQWKQLTLLMNRNKKNETIKIEVTNVDKSERTNIHYSIKKRYNGKLCSNTVTDLENRKFIIFGTNKNVDQRNNSNWPADLPQYLHFVLYKENIDTINAARIICKSLRVSQNIVSYAGTKDRRGVTTQLMCIKRINAKRMSSLSRDRLWFGNFEYKSKPLKLGELKGNMFRVVLRNIESPDENIRKTLTGLKENGFLNYYGLQRFGSYSAAPTYEIGRYLISNQWKKAIDLILNPRFDENQSDLQEACKIWSETGNATEAAKCLKPYTNCAESIILRTLTQQGNIAYVNALQKVPRNIILLYIHSFQSIVWNRIVSRRVSEFGFEVLAGDLVYTNNDTNNLSLEDDSSEKEIEDCQNYKTVKVVSADDINEIRIQDVVYPLPGFSVKYPENIIAKWYAEILAEYGLCFDTFDKKNKMFSACGDYRKMIILPQNVEWKYVFYNNPSADLLSTDLQKLKNEYTVENLEDGTYKAVILKLNLPSCCYATMALREITKSDTSSNYQASLTSLHLQEKKSKLDCTS